MMFRDNFSSDEKYKLFRNMYEVIHPTISKRNISNYRIVLDENILPIRVFYPKILSTINSAILFVPGEGNISNCFGEYENIHKDGYKFIGWNTKIDGTGTSYNKVTSALSDYSGEYLIVYEGSSCVLDGSLTTLDAKGNYQKVSIASNSISWTQEVSNYSFTIEKYGNGYSILSSSGKYIGSTASNSNTLTTSTTPLVNEIIFSGNELNIRSSAGTYLRYNTSDNRFRYYKSSSYQSQALFSLYPPPKE